MSSTENSSSIRQLRYVYTYISVHIGEYIWNIYMYIYIYTYIRLLHTHIIYIYIYIYIYRYISVPEDSAGVEVCWEHIRNTLGTYRYLRSLLVSKCARAARSGSNTLGTQEVHIRNTLGTHQVHIRNALGVCQGRCTLGTH